MKKKIKSIMSVLEYFFVFFCFTILVMSIFRKSVQTTEHVSNEIVENYEEIAEVIVWNTDYSKELEFVIIQTLNQLPDNVLASWLEKDGSVVVCPNIKGYLDAGVGDAIEKHAYTTAYNEIITKGDDVLSSDIYILGAQPIIESSLVHEIGHYVYYEYFGGTTDYILPNYEKDNVRFAEQEKDGVSYYSAPEEYFAELFAYTILNGVTDEYADTHEMKKIIEKF